MRRIAAGVCLALTMSAIVSDGAHAAWRDDHQVLRVGFLTTAGAGYDARRLEPFRAYLESWLPLPVELVPEPTYAALIDAQVTDRVQYAIHSATSYVVALTRCDCIETVAMPSAFNGARGFYSILVARADSAINSVNDAEGVRLAVAGKDSIAGYQVPITFLARDGIDPDRFFGAIGETDGPEAAMTALLAGEADLAVSWSSLTGDTAGGYDFGLLSRMVQDGVLLMNQVRPIWASPLIPFGPHAVRSEVPDPIKRQLVDALTSMAESSLEALDAVDRSTIGGGGFIAVSDEDYAVIKALVAEPDPANELDDLPAESDSPLPSAEPDEPLPPADASPLPD